MAARAKAAVSTNGNGSVIDISKPVASTSPQIVIDPIAQETMLVPIIGTAPLIVHRFSEKAKKQMLDNMQGVKNPKQPKNPIAEYEGAFYRYRAVGSDGSYLTEMVSKEILIPDPDNPGQFIASVVEEMDYVPSPDDFGLPVISFKAATVEASRFYGKDVTKVGLRQFLFLSGETGYDGQMLARIEAEGLSDPHMREDVVRVGQGGTDLRYRPEWSEWRTVLQVTYVTSALTRKSVLSLIDAGGLGVGVGEWRPEKNGVNGTYRIDTSRDVEVLD